MGGRTVAGTNFGSLPPNGNGRGFSPVPHTAMDLTDRDLLALVRLSSMAYAVDRLDCPAGHVAIGGRGKGGGTRTLAKSWGWTRKQVRGAVDSLVRQGWIRRTQTGFVIVHMEGAHKQEASRFDAAKTYEIDALREGPMRGPQRGPQKGNGLRAINGDGPTLCGDVLRGMGYTEGTQKGTPIS